MQMAEAGVLLWVEEVMLGEQACGPQNQKPVFFCGEGWLKMKYLKLVSISFNILLKTSHKKKKLLRNGIFEMFLLRLASLSPGKCPLIGI